MALQVETGIQSDSHIEVLDGLSEGDEIVTGNYRAISQLLQNNSKVKTQGEDESGDTLAAN
jgi:HlyD family secretion protein